MTRALRTIRLGIRSLLLHALRSSLTVLGIMFGVLAVIVMLAVGEGANYEAQQRIKALGSTNIILQSVKPADNRDNAEGNSRTLKYGLLYDDASLIRETLPGVNVMVSARDYPKELQYRTQISQGTARGTVPWFPKVARLGMLQGTFFSELHERNHSNVCVLTPEVAQKLFLHEYPIGKVIKVGLDPFTVIGVIESKSGVVKDGGQPTDNNVNVIYIPLSASRIFFGEQILKRTSGNFSREDVQLHEIQVQVASTLEVMPVAESIKAILKHNHENTDYKVIVPLELLRTAKESKRMFGIVLALIAGISLLVGGIGIMNIMLASVTERTREIGIRRALGAQKRHIVMQFLVETIVLSSLGGVMGVILGLIAPVLITEFTNQTTIVKPGSVIMSFGVSAMVGVVFGLYPAIRAANLDPIKALRHE